jgi:two-component system phosphate regulon sensor histidine kinase PhoR
MSPKVQGILWFFAVLLFMTAMFVLTFFITNWIYETAHLTLPPLAVQLINSLGGLVLTAAIMRVLIFFAQPRITAGQMRLFAPIIEALERIAKGDFSARVSDIFDRRSPERGMFGELVNSINQMALELDRMENMRQEFISNVSHEIQSPLTSIRGFAQALQNDHLSADERQHYLTIIETESSRLSKLSDNLLKLASLEAEQMKFEPKTYRLDKQIRNLVLACEPQWAGKSMEIEVCLDALEITADEDLLSQVWMNLISNSIKFTPTGGKIGLHLHRDGDTLQFKIEDSGIGITPEDQAHVFERFYKVDKSRTRSNNSGSGLGLAIAKKIIEIHKGELTVSSQLNSGTTFTVSLPSLT